MKLASVVGVVALGACNRGADTVPDASQDAWPEYNIPLDIDVVVLPSSVIVYLNSSDVIEPGFGRNDDFPEVDTCVGDGDYFELPVTCVQRAALVGGEQRYELDLAYPSLSGPRPDQLPDDFALEIEGCDSEPARIPIDRAGMATPVIDIQRVGNGVNVSWTSVQPWSSALVSQGTDISGVTCHTAEAAFAFDRREYYIGVTLLESPVMTTGSWGVARVWPGAGEFVPL